ncbi:MAG: hypothetical protein OZ921_08705 [Sorangiineae bacterium]|nr:hypothetical protein [Polyangiaceae bacterium]MEB2322580.1 hypothetical protein [Sorangiineae bacterium]
MTRAKLERTLGILLAGMLQAEQQLASEQAGSGVYRLLPFAIEPGPREAAASPSPPPQGRG